MSFNGDRQLPGTNPTAEPVDHRSQIDEATRHRDVRDVNGTDLIGPRDGQAAQQVGVNLVSWRGFGRVGPAIDGLDRHLPHQHPDMPAADLQSLLPEQIAQPPVASKRVIQVQLVDAQHQPQVRLRDRPWPVVDAAAADRKHLGLSLDGKIVPRGRSSLYAQKSRLGERPF